MKEVRVYIVSRDGQPIGAFATPQAASTFLVQQPIENNYRSRYRLTSLILNGVFEETEEAPCAEPS